MMNKYQEALNNICNRCCNYESCLGLDCPDREELELLIENYQTLEYMDTPKKPIYSDYDDDGDEGIIPNKAECPTCHYEFEFGHWNEYENHHCECGQRIDWSEEDE